MFRSIEGVYPAPQRHWVGDGFHVAGYFSAIPNAVRKLDPFLMLDYHMPHHYPPAPRPRGVGVHPHRGFETVTLAWQGRVAHHDSTGAGGVIGPGDVQWMTAGSGILHKEYHEADWSKQGGTFQMAQLWVNLPKRDKMEAPHYQALAAADMGQVVLPAEAGVVRIVAGAFEGVRGPAVTHSPINVFDVRLNPAGKVTFHAPAHQNLAILVMQGDLEVNGNARATANDFVVFQNAGDEVEVVAHSPAHLLVLNGEPLREPVVQYGPFVMTSRAEIEQAILDYQGGKFGHLAN